MGLGAVQENGLDVCKVKTPIAFDHHPGFHPQQVVVTLPQGMGEEKTEPASGQFAVCFFLPAMATYPNLRINTRIQPAIWATASKMATMKRQRDRGRTVDGRFQ